MVREYIGARYVPKYDGEWDINKSYEPLTIVGVDNVASYTSKKYVPVGIAITNTDYWVQTGNLNGAIVDLQNDMTQAKSDIVNLQLDVTQLQGSVLGIGQDVNSLSGTVTSLENDVDALKDKIPLTRRFVTIADSYGNAPSPSQGWNALLEGIMGGYFYNMSQGSMGFYKVGGSGTNALGMLQGNMSSIAEPSTITDFVIAIGLNDYTETLADIGTAIDSLVAYIKTNFPIATIWMGFPENSWNFTLAEHNNMINIINLIKDKCGALGCRFMSGLEYIMHDTTMYSSDLVHPTLAGSTEIANGIACILNGGEYTYKNAMTSEITWNTGAISYMDQIIDGPITRIRISECASPTTAINLTRSYQTLATAGNSIVRNGRISMQVMMAIISGSTHTPVAVDVTTAGNSVFLKVVGDAQSNVIIANNDINICCPTIEV